MPAGSTPVRHIPQNSPGACLPACVQMILAALGRERSQEQIARQLGSYEFGTPAGRVCRLRKWGYQVEYGSASLDDVRHALHQGWHPILFVRADLLPWADFGGFHALVVESLTSEAAYVLDPALKDGPTLLSLDWLTLAWEEFDNRMAVVKK